ncbi:Rne/Rng family ribonuclease [Mesorhizobium sp. L-8-3]|uniref:Rne/Rng family ribonuclease n=1 Tax=Mesorhizobium sp. L-8-3 TaxID=2744522 RepID=UPI00192915F2|nr:ribonuclease E/G [Mesorhizobium sp. L-8-3]
MPNKMLIDASHPEETRVVVVRGNRIEEFDFESQDKKQLKGNIYLARVTRVEPSLQAAFVEYGGNRHGFLAFSEIHPDYYQIPVADRQALLRAEAEADDVDDEEDAEGDDRSDRGRNRRRRRGGRHRGRDQERRDAAEASDEAEAQAVADTEGDGDVEANDPVPAESEQPALVDDQPAATQDAPADHAEAPTEESTAVDAGDGEAAPASGEVTSIAASIEADVVSEPVAVSEAPDANEDRGTVEEISGAQGDESEVESVGAEDALEEIRNRRKPMRRHYKIQEVIKRRQILLVQVVKEERGNKGAALTTYLSLAGRYSVLMPNTARGGGISRKITNAQDRKRLKEVVQDLDVPEGMGVILRTAGESRTKAEIKRDYEYLMRLWENVRSLTLESTAPALVYEEGSLIKRSVRDLYNKDIDEILVSGEEGYREAKDFMRMLMPSHAKVVQPFRDTTPIFARSGIEAQLDRMLQPQVTLKSGGYIIINQTEALVSIDVNSGRSTREHSIEDTALQTNLEAAEEVARQLRLRDLAGLIVIDFIDMEENRNNRAVEKKLKDCLKNDRARIQVGRISHFGLLEMSRQRIRASVLESTMKPCPHCGGTGHVRSDSSTALLVVRAIEEFLLKDSRHHITVRTPMATALYVLNHKRSMLVDLERRFGLTITLEADDSVASQHYAIFRGAVAEKSAVTEALPAQLAYVEPEEPEEEIVEEEDVEETAAAEQSSHGERREDGDRKRRKRRRRRGKDRDRDASDEHRRAADAESVAATSESPEDGDVEDVEGEETVAAEADGAADRKKRRRGRRGGRRHRQEDGEPTAATEAAEGEVPETSEPVVEAVEADAAELAAESAPPAESVAEAAAEAVETPAEPVAEAVAEPEKPKRKPRKSAKAKKAEAEAAAAAEAEAAAGATGAETAPAETVAEEPAPEPAKRRTRATRRKPEAEAAPAEAVVVSSTVAEVAEIPAEEAKPKKAGWWQRKGFF